MPEHTVGRVYLRYVAKQAFDVDLCEYLMGLQIAEAVQKELEKEKMEKD